MSKYGIGERWYCDRSVGGNPYNRPPFYFVIVANGRPGHKWCRLEKVDGTPVHARIRDDDPIAHEYSHKHLKKYAVHSAQLSAEQAA
jgi:hypothetical protein